MSIQHPFKALIVLCALTLNSMGQVLYTLEGNVGRLQHSNSSSGLSFADNSFFRVEVTVTNFSATCCDAGLGRNYEVASALLTSPDFGLLNEPVLNDNLEVGLFDNGVHEQFSLDVIFELTPSGGRVYDNILFDSTGLNFLNGPFVPSPFNRDLNGVPLQVGGSWRNAFELADGSALGLWFGTFNGNIQAVPEPRAITLTLVGMLVLVSTRWRLIRRRQGDCK